MSAMFRFTVPISFAVAALAIAALTLPVRSQSQDTALSVTPKTW
jgi:hypothetical protein